MTQQVFQAVSRTPLSLLVARQLRDAIVSGALPVGTLLPSEKELTEQFRVSRPTVREALRILQAQGLLSGGDTVSTVRPQVSTEHTSGGAALALENAVRMGGIPLGDLLELRLLLERAAVLAADPTSPALDEAREALQIMATSDVDIARFHAEDVRFHLCLVHAGGNQGIALVMSVLREAISDHLMKGLAAYENPRRVMTKLVKEHTRILDAVCAGDGAAAAELIDAHVSGFYRSSVQA